MGYMTWAVYFAVKNSKLLSGIVLEKVKRSLKNYSSTFVNNYSNKKMQENIVKSLLKKS